MYARPPPFTWHTPKCPPGYSTVPLFEPPKPPTLTVPRDPFAPEEEEEPVAEQKEEEPPKDEKKEEEPKSEEPATEENALAEAGWCEEAYLKVSSLTVAQQMSSQTRQHPHSTSLHLNRRPMKMPPKPMKLLRQQRMQLSRLLPPKSLPKRSFHHQVVSL